jgi:magnesium-protoporphyrin IX monomethyl ester (oxidative) cyclase
VLDVTAEGYYHEEDDVNGFFRFGLSMADIRTRIEAAQPDAVGVGCLYSPMWPVVRDILAVTKSIDPGIVTLVGGNHPTFLARECLERDGDRNLDFIVLGEGEESSKHVFQCLEKGHDFDQIDGLAYVDDSCDIVIQPKTHQIEDLDAIPFPARDLMPLDGLLGPRPSGTAPVPSQTSLPRSRK